MKTNLARSLGSSLAEAIGLVTLLGLSTLVGCSGEGSSSGSSSPSAARHSPQADNLGSSPEAPSEVLATIDGRPVMMSDLVAAAGDDLAQLDMQYRSRRHDLMEAALQRLVRDRILDEEAAAQGRSKDDLLQAEVLEKAKVSDQDVQVWYEQNRTRLASRPFEELAPQIRQFLEQGKRAEAEARVFEALEKSHGVVYLLEPPRVRLETEGSPAHGPADAPVTVVEFSDFECGYCRQLADTLEQVKENYGGKVRVVFRQFPLDMHPNAAKAAEASLCAGDQDKFWPMHDRMFQEQNRLDIASLKDVAGQIGLDRAAFDRCLDSGRHAAKVEKDLREGKTVGVSGTPALFVNGVPVPGGAVPYERLAQFIDRELKRVDSE